MKILTALLLTAAAAVAQSTVNFSAGPAQRDVRLATGQPVMTGTVSIGYFEDVWIEYGSTDIREIFGQPGRFAGVASRIEDHFSGEQIFLRIDAGFTGGLYTSSLDNWVFPDPFDIFPNNTGYINSSEIDTVVYGFLNDNHLILVPEPQTMHILTVVGLIGVGLYLIGGKRK
jgi:hypothetical protein